ncbi:MAG: type II toxin-antitoxin system RelE/ParE family toxin [Deltaproteobacteria bacterium]|nr:type II toxin-antitoxin system RelE/ParE family toxin [Deltaproteobacteria bacterium]
MPFEILYHSDCLRKDIPKLDRHTRQRVERTIKDRLMTDPATFGKPLRHTTQGIWSLRVGDWRIIYKIAGPQVWILRIGHRREVYKLAIPGL